MVHVTIIGAGVAGLAAAVAAVQRGHRVTILEARRFAGGRAYAFCDPATQQTLDNGQHLLMGCYQSTFEYLRTIGSAAQVEQCGTFDVTFRRADGSAPRLQCPPWPAPLHFAAGLWKMAGFSRGDLFRLGVGALPLMRMRPEVIAAYDNISVAQWLDTLGQSAVARKLFWEPLCLAVMNDTLDRASVAPLLAILREGLFNRAVPQGLAFPRASLSALFVDPALAWLAGRGARIDLGVGVDALTLQNDRIGCIRTMRGDTLPIEQIVCALSPRELLALLQRSGLAAAAPWSALAAWDTVPIVSVHLWYDRAILADRMVGLLDSPFDWVFPKDDISGAHCVALVASAARDVAELPRAELLALAQCEVARFFPVARDATLRHAQMTKELHATVSLTPGSAARRLGPATPYANCWLAGDWTNTGLPATIESAIRSGGAAIRALG